MKSLVATAPPNGTSPNHHGTDEGINEGTNEAANDGTNEGPQWNR
ncbi:hypothetical protein [Acidovorax carolinensis]|jgi:hypothetical protein|nr:hypothetical protein [Acidovorax carolinensis]